MMINSVNNVKFTGKDNYFDNKKPSKEMEHLMRDDLTKVGKSLQKEALENLDEQHKALFTALNAQMVQNQFELLNKLDKIEGKVDKINWGVNEKYTDPMAPFM